MIFFALLFVFLIILSFKKPDFTFWIAATVFFDPGGFIADNIPRSVIMGLQVTDLTFVLLFIPFISPKVSVRLFFDSRLNRSIFMLLTSFTLIYHILIFGYFAAGFEFDNLIDTLRYQRLTLFGYLSLIPAYVFFLRDYQLGIRFAVITSAVIAILYLITIFSPLNILPLQTFERGLGISTLRISMLSYGFGYLVLAGTMVSLFMPALKIRFKGLIFFVGLVFSFAIILTLTRRSIFGVFFLMMLVYVVSQKIKSRKVFESSLLLRIIPLVIAVVFIGVLKYDSFESGLKLVFSAFEGVVGEELEDGRISYEIPAHLGRYFNSPMFGDGWDPLWYSNDKMEGGLSANDVPLTAALGMFGTLGVLFYSLYYFWLYKRLRFGIKMLRFLYPISGLNLQSLIIVVTLLICVLFSKYLSNFFLFFEELIKGEARVRTSLVIGFLLAGTYLLELRVNTVYAQGEAKRNEDLHS
jgi:hypothetical protein